jgi:hypothetical protein
MNFAKFIPIMITKINPQATIDFKTTPSLASSRAIEGSDFHSLLQEKLEQSEPLEWIFIHYLTRTLERLLSDEGSKESGLFLSPPVPRTSPTQPLPTNSPPPAEVSNNLQKKQVFDRIIGEAAQNYGVEPSLIRAVIQAESAGNPQAISPAGAQGLMQLMPETATELGVSNAFDPDQNIMAGTRYLRQLLDRYRGDVRLTLAAYNWGMGNLENRPGALPQETKTFIARVQNYYQRYKESSQTT